MNLLQKLDTACLFIVITMGIEILHECSTPTSAVLTLCCSFKSPKVKRKVGLLPEIDSKLKNTRIHLAKMLAALLLSPVIWVIGFANKLLEMVIGISLVTGKSSDKKKSYEDFSRFGHFMAYCQPITYGPAALLQSYVRVCKFPPKIPCPGLP